MFCLKCGSPIPDNSEICPVCGENPKEDVNLEQNVIVYSDSEIPDSLNEKTHKNKKLFICLGCAIALVVMIFAINIIQINNLKNRLTKENWYSADEGYTILKVLEFDENKVEYRLETGYSFLDTSLFKRQYKVVSGNKFKVKISDNKWETYTVKFSDDKTVMEVEPALTSTDKIEYWADIS